MAESQEEETEVKAPPGGDNPLNKSRVPLKMARTLFLYIAYVCLGLQIAEGGVTFLDLLLLLRTDVEQGSILYTAGSVGYAFGALASGWVFDSLNPDGLLFLILLYMGSFNIAMVYCPRLWAMSAVNAFRAVALASLDTGGNAVCVRMWKDEGSPYLQALHLSFSLGGVIAPFIAAPYLAPKPNDTSNPASISGFHNKSSVTERSDLASVSPSTLRLNSTDFLVPITTRVYYVYIIIGCTTIAASFPFLVLWLKNRSFCRETISREGDTAERREGKSNPTKEPENESAKEISHSHGSKVVMLILLGLFYAADVSLEVFIQGYLMTFVVKYLDWDKSEGARITSVFWGTFAGSRLLGILMSKFLSPRKMLLANLVLLNSAFLPLLFVTKQRDVIVWICIPLSGVFMATIFPTGISWTNQNIMNVSGKVTSILILSSTVGGLFNPMLLGYLFKNISPMWLIYLVISYGMMCLVIFLALTAILRLIGRKSYSVSAVGAIT